MLKIRIFEERVAGLLDIKEIVCSVRLYVGQEAISSGVRQDLNENNYSPISIQVMANIRDIK